MAELEVESLGFLDRGPIDLRVSAGSCSVLSGASGSGKTLLLRAIADLDPHTGSVRLDGRPCAAFAPADWRRRVGLLPAESAWWHATFAEHFPPDAACSLPLDEALAALQLERGALSWRIERASTGERQRLALLRLLARGPEVLLLDEPTANLDPETTRCVEACVARYRREHEAAALWVAHDAAQVARVAEAHLVLDRGRIVTESA